MDIWRHLKSNVQKNIGKGYAFEARILPRVITAVNTIEIPYLIDILFCWLFAELIVSISRLVIYIG